MSYVSLARKYRPRRFVDMVGQESTTLALTNAIRLRREPHSVIFTGVRGVGKTTSARIYAKALNCENGPTADPCDICASCVAIASGNHEDVLEIDGASNTGVDDVRALQETLSYVPQRSTYKIYIIDEVHMLSISAFNALLKTLEEPPQHVIFIFATTELHKVPETIQSRCQTFHLQKISRPVIAERVRAILTAEGIPFDEGALALVAREGRGSMRDALTMLDQAIAVGGGQVSLDALRSMVGSSSQALPVLELLDGLLRKDASQILEVIARWDQEGLAMSTLVEETAKACRNAFILRDLKGQAIDLQLLELEDREQQMLLELGEKAAPMDLNRLFRQLAKCLDDLRHADLDRFILENYCLEWCFDPGLPDLQTLMNIMASGQPLPQIQARPAVPTAPQEGSAINLRERWKTSSPAPTTNPAPRPAVPPTPQAPAPKPQAPLSKAPVSPQATLDAPLPPSPGQVVMSQASTQPIAVNGSGMPSSLVQKLAMAQAAQAAQAVPAQPAVNPLRAAREAHNRVEAKAMEAKPGESAVPSEPAIRVGRTVTMDESAVSAKNAAPESLSPVNTQSTVESAKPAPELSTQNPGSTEASPAVSTHAPQPVNVASSREPTASAQAVKPEASAVAESRSAPPADPGAPAKSLRSLLDTAAQNAPKPQPKPIVKAGGSARLNGPAMPPEPPPFDASDDGVPPWVLQDEVSRQGAMLAPMDDPEPAKNDSFLQQMARRAAAEPAQKPVQPTVEAPAPSAAAPSDPVWPENWRAFVEEWKKQKPLQGRVLEEAYLLEYTPQRIRLAVEPTSMAGGKLLQQDFRKRLSEMFTVLFGFKGILEAVPKADANPGKSPDLGETLLDVKNRERELAREHLRARLEDHPMTREVISRFGGTIEQIELQ